MTEARTLVPCRCERYGARSAGKEHLIGRQGGINTGVVAAAGHGPVYVIGGIVKAPQVK